ncbi:IPTL-CTERM sorting domain-containing protein [Dokdonella sp.]|uniref:IPTL-CTERM sorting domain-containing protein n=1 Tax=Dokdonella sp. TaxID=2291710 RepID=UPI0025C3BB33|nr:IPTL-CTERM sorting domain-containing protein [Dokdonella sp.]
MVAAGTCTVVASQAGDANWLPAADVSQTITIVAGFSTVTQLPTLSHWVLLLLAVLMGTLAWRRIN